MLLPEEIKNVIFTFCDHQMLLNFASLNREYSDLVEVYCSSFLKKLSKTLAYREKIGFLNKTEETMLRWPKPFDYTFQSATQLYCKKISFFCFKCKYPSFRRNLWGRGYLHKLCELKSPEFERITRLKAKRIYMKTDDELDNTPSFSFDGGTVYLKSSFRKS